MALLATSIGQIAPAKSGDAIAAVYEVSVNGVSALVVTYNAEIADSGYRSRASVTTKGVAALFSSYHLDMAASGAIEGGKAMPVRFSSIVVKKDKTKSISVNWSPAGLPQYDRYPNRDPRVQSEIATAITAGTADPLSSILLFGSSPIKNPCAVAKRVFDGQEVFDLGFSLDNSRLPLIFGSSIAGLPTSAG